MKNKLIPPKQGDKMTKAGEFNAKITATGFDPASVGLTPADVMAFTAAYNAAKAAYLDRGAAKETKKAKTTAFSGTGGLLDQLVATWRDQANKIRVSSASDDQCVDLGVDRRKASPTPKSVPANPPGVTLDSLQPGLIRLRIYDTGSAGARARAENANGSQLAVVNGTAAIVSNEADTVPTILAPRSPWTLDSTKMPGTVRIYARWQTQRGELGPWSAPLTVKVA